MASFRSHWRVIFVAVVLAGPEVVRDAAGQTPRGAFPLPPVLADGVRGENQPLREPQKFLEQLFDQMDQMMGGKVDLGELEKVSLSMDEEQRYGAAQLAALRRDLKRKGVDIAEKGRDVAYVARLVAMLQPHMKQAGRYRSIRVYVANSDLPDALTLAGGHVMVSRGLFDFAACEAALVGVLGHELAHLDRGHLVRHVKQVKLAERAWQPESFARGFSFDDLLAKTKTMQGVFRRPFGPEEELDADLDGMAWAHRLGYDARALAELWDRMAARQTRPGVDFLPAFFRTHPRPAERSAAVRQAHERLQTAEPQPDLYLGVENLRRRVTRDEKRFPDR